MGYISIQINKAKGSADTGTSDHIERKTTPKNADPTRTHLNRESLKGRLNRLGEARAWDYKQYQRKNSKFVFGADLNRLLSSVG